MGFKDKLKGARDNINMARMYGDKRGQEIVIKGFDTYRAVSNAIIFCFICGFIIVEKWNYLFIALIIWHFHILINQLWWRVANLEYKTENKNSSIRIRQRNKWRDTYEHQADKVPEALQESPGS